MSIVFVVHVEKNRPAVLTANIQIELTVHYDSRLSQSLVTVSVESFHSFLFLEKSFPALFDGRCAPGLATRNQAHGAGPKHTASTPKYPFEENRRVGCTLVVWSSSPSYSKSTACGRGVYFMPLS
jgi:hypothetical protein